MHPYVYNSIIYIIAKLWKNPKCPVIDEWIKKSWYRQRGGILFSHEKDEIVPCAMTWVELESIMLREINQSEKDKHHLISLIREIKEAKQTSMGEKRGKLRNRL